MKDLKVSSQDCAEASSVSQGVYTKLSAIALALIAIVLCLSLAGCGSSEEKKDEESNATQTEESTSADSSDDKAASSSNATDANWKKTLSDYEKWVDDYAELMKKAQDNPTDASLASEAAQMAAESTEWAQDIASLNESDLSESELSEYKETMERINEKLVAVF